MLEKRNRTFTRRLSLMKLVHFGEEDVLNSVGKFRWRYSSKPKQQQAEHDPKLPTSLKEVHNAVRHLNMTILI